MGKKPCRVSRSREFSSYLLAPRILRIRKLDEQNYFANSKNSLL